MIQSSSQSNKIRNKKKKSWGPVCLDVSTFEPMQNKRTETKNENQSELFWVSLFFVSSKWFETSARRTTKGTTPNGTQTWHDKTYEMEKKNKKNRLMSSWNRMAFNLNNNNNQKKWIIRQSIVPFLLISRESHLTLAPLPPPPPP